MWKHALAIAAFAFLAACSGANPDYVAEPDPAANGGAAPTATAIGGAATSSNGGAPAPGSTAPGTTSPTLTGSTTPTNAPAPGSTTPTNGPAPGSTTTTNPTPGSTTTATSTCNRLVLPSPSACASDQDIAEALDKLVRKCEDAGGVPTQKLFDTAPTDPQCVVAIGLLCC